VGQDVHLGPVEVLEFSLGPGKFVVLRVG